ncbi:MarR family winged helix-turn-helix transcriptional regulator [Roseomonas elaeocarpi]|uniref:MarR family winged helix-turn-helix transcriptional regulator n=1 Tax=Roseomonas elaeocarpi TaxID=907779 RepID=A0ABV6JRL3_9PROT
MADTERDLLRLDEQTCFALYSASHALNRAYAPLLEPLDLTYPQYLVMLVLWERDGLLVKEIGQRLLLDTGTLTPLLKRMEAAGLLSRTRDPADERQVRVALTAQGLALREKARAIPPRVACAMDLPQPELVALRDGLLRLRENLVRAD